MSMQIAKLIIFSIFIYPASSHPVGNLDNHSQRDYRQQFLLHHKLILQFRVLHHDSLSIDDMQFDQV